MYAFLNARTVPQPSVCGQYYTNASQDSDQVFLTWRAQHGDQAGKQSQLLSQ